MIRWVHQGPWARIDSRDNERGGAHEKWRTDSPTLDTILGLQVPRQVTQLDRECLGNACTFAVRGAPLSFRLHVFSSNPETVSLYRICITRHKFDLPLQPALCCFSHLPFSRAAACRSCLAGRAMRGLRRALVRAREAVDDWQLAARADLFPSAVRRSAP